MDEARTVLPAVMHLENHGSEAVQKYIDSMCARMDDKSSPEHHIAIQFGDDRILQTHSSHPITDEQLATIIAAPDRAQLRLQSEDNDLQIAVYAEGDKRVIVREKLAQLRSAVLGDELFRLIGIGLMGIITDAVVICHCRLCRRRMYLIWLMVLVRDRPASRRIRVSRWLSASI